MTLLDHFAPDAGMELGQNGFEQFSVHLFTAALNLWAKTTVTRAQVIAAFGMDATDEIQLDLIKAVYDGKNNTGKPLYLHDIESALIAYEEGKINQATVATHLEV